MSEANWKQVKLKEISSKIGSGATPRGGKNAYIEKGISLIRSQNIYDLTFEYSDLAHITEDQAKELDNVTVKKNDVLLNITGASVARCTITPNDILPARVNQHVAIIRVKDDIADPYFVLYSLVSNQNKKRLLTFAQGGATREALTKERIERFEISIPTSLDQQRKVSAVLLSYDLLRKVNSRRIYLLERMAKFTYDEWFVKFRFPGHEKVKMVDSEFGTIPRGWEVKNLNEISRNFDSKRIPLSSLKRAEIQGAYPYYGAAKVLDHVNNYVFDGKYLLIAEDGSVVTSEGYPVLQFVNCKFWANNHTHILEGIDPISTEFLFLKLSGYSILGHITGAAQPKINQENLNRIHIVIAPDEIMKAFNRIVVPIFDQISILEKMNQNLSDTRNVLLRELISGRIDVSNLDIKDFEVEK